MSAIAKLSPPIRRNLWFLFASGLVFWSCMASLLPILPLYIKDLNATAQELGIIMGSFAAGLLIFRPHLGKMVDSGGRKLVLILGILVAMTAPVAYLLVTQKFALIGVRIFHGISIAAFATAYNALVADISPPKHRGEVIGTMSLTYPIGMAFGPLLGDWVLRSRGYSNYSDCFWLASTLAAVSFVLATQIVVPANPKSATQAQNIQPFWKILTNNSFRLPTLTLLVVGLAFGILSTFVPLYVRENQLHVTASAFYSSAAIMGFATRSIAGKQSDRYGRGRFITLGMAAYALSMALLWLIPSDRTFILAGLIEGIGSGMFLPVTMATITDRCSPELRGRIFALSLSGFDLGIFTAGPSLGGIADSIGYRGLFGVATGIVAIGILLFVTLSSKDLQHSLAFSLFGGRDVYALPQKSLD
jgi:MFS family permease